MQIKIYGKYYIRHTKSIISDALKLRSSRRFETEEEGNFFFVSSFVEKSLLTFSYFRSCCSSSPNSQVSTLELTNFNTHKNCSLLIRLKNPQTQQAVPTSPQKLSKKRPLAAGRVLGPAPHKSQKTKT